MQEAEVGRQQGSLAWRLYLSAKVPRYATNGGSVPARAVNQPSWRRSVGCLLSSLAAPWKRPSPAERLANRVRCESPILDRKHPLSDTTF
jgi:hypothetical protein